MLQLGFTSNLNVFLMYHLMNNYIYIHILINLSIIISWQMLTSSFLFNNLRERKVKQIPVIEFLLIIKHIFIR